jgi:hypothetical protein
MTHIKGKIFWVTLLLVVINISRLFAQGCGPPDPDSGDIGDCPLDTWVLVLAAIALIFVTIQLYNRRRVDKLIA